MNEITLRLATAVRHSLHELMGFLELAADEPGLNRQSDSLSNCRLTSDRLLRVVADLTELSNQQLPVHTATTFQPASAVAEIVELASPLAARKGLTLDWAFTPASQGRIQAPQDLIQDILRRLLDNAIRFTTAGRVRVSADVCVVATTTLLVVELADTGAGMPAETVRFLESKDLTLLPEHGLGLGVAVVRQRVMLMGGEVSVVSTPAVGTIVRFSLPVTLPVSEDDTREVRRNRVAPLPMNLLVVEDSDDGFFVFEGYLRDAGHKLTRAVDGAEAVRFAQSEIYDLIVMDANMPRMDGYSATKAIRDWESASGATRRTPILLFSADDPIKQSNRGGSVGCSGYLSKPATKEEVLRALRFYEPQATVLHEVRLEK